MTTVVELDHTIKALGKETQAGTKPVPTWKALTVHKLTVMQKTPAPQMVQKKKKKAKKPHDTFRTSTHT